ncbi:MAG: hypothetical protein M1819_004232 [Sarea resinae]|nr:MAG: hypothetical protein M1819_004232 [Sarea resinae]
MASAGPKRRGEFVLRGRTRVKSFIEASSVASNSDNSLIDASALKFNRKDKAAGSIKLKRPGFKQSKPGNWKESEVMEPKKTDSPSKNVPTSPSPLVNQLDEKDVAAFPNGRPMEDQPETVLCKHCKKPFHTAFIANHIKWCIKQRQERQERNKKKKEAALAREKDTKEKGKDGDSKADETPNGKGAEEAESAVKEKVKGAKKSAAKATTEDGQKKGKKRKADGDAEKPPKAKKKKEEPKPKVPKPKGPVDVERQCGVVLPNGAQCARSLTCKSHSMGAKRAVPGRSLPYDMLLAQYQKKNQAKQQKAAIDANAPLQDEFEATGPVDSDEEKDAVMAAISRSRPQPLEQRILISTRRKYQYVRMKEMLSSALGGSRGGGLFSTGDAGGRAPLPGEDMGAGNGFSSVLGNGGADSNELNGRRPSLMQQALAGQNRAMFPGQAQHSRKASTPSAQA